MFIVRDSGFFNLELFDESMADRRFKIKRRTHDQDGKIIYSTQQSKVHADVPAEVRKTSNIANVRIYADEGESFQYPEE